MPELKFLSNEGDIDVGLGDAGIETFRDTPYASVARECGQNSSDARSGNPVNLSFDLIEVDSSELPSLDSFRSSIEYCLTKAKTSDTEKEVEFFERARNELSKDTIKILKISDSNTKGVVGPCEQGTPFHSLLKGSGVSVKNDPTSGGSFGIGKNAAFAVSDIQTVFYSTKYNIDDSYNTETLYQGKSILISHTDDQDNKNLAVGYWGDEGYQPISDSEKVPEWLRREDIGTSLYCICFRETEDWELRLAASLMQNFFCAIYRNEMNFSINNGNHVINKNTLISLFERSDIEQAAVKSGNGEDYVFSKRLIECLVAIETKEEIIEVKGLGRVSVKILVKEGFPKRVCFIRNGMFITDNLENFGEKFLRFPMYKDFVALVEPLDSVGISLFKKLENPRHDGLSSERLSSEIQRNEATSAMKKLGVVIRNAIRAQSLEIPKNSVIIDELSEFFADEVDPEKIQDPDAAEDNPETFKYTPKKRVPQKKLGDGIDQEGSGGGSGSDSGKGTGGTGGGTSEGGGKGGNGKRSGGKTINLKNNRNLIIGNDLKKRQLIFESDDNSNAMISVFAEGLNSPEKIEIMGSDSGVISSGSLKLALEKDRKEIIVVEFPYEYDGPIEVIARSTDSENSEAANEN